jgi:NAD(P)H dehydrogenase (quinone)
MKHLIIYAHPNDGSLNHHLLQFVVDCLKSKRHEFKIRDLYQLNFNPILSSEDIKGQRMGEVAKDIKQEQDHISWSEQITFIYPIWWTGMPAIMKGFIDRVFSYGFAYRYDQNVQKGLLTQKLTNIINTHGKSQAEYESIGMNKALSLTSDIGIFTYCGLEINKHIFFDQADKANSDVIEKWKHQISQMY